MPIAHDRNMLEQKFNFSVKDLILIYHLMPKSLCVAIKLWMVCVFEVVTILTIFKNFRSPEFHQWLVPSHSAACPGWSFSRGS